MQCCPAGTVGPPEGQNVIQPLFHQGRAAIEIKRELKNHSIVFSQQSLLNNDINLPIGIARIELAHRHLTGIIQSIRPRPMES
jgi:hypothetical protein